MTSDIITLITAQPQDELQAIVSQILEQDAIPVGELTVTKIGRSVGLATAGIFRVSGHAQIQGTETAWSAVVKALGTPENMNPTVNSGNSHAVREIEIYRSRAFAEVCGGVRGAKCYAIQPHHNIQLLWLEDLSAAPQPPWQPEHFLATARHLGQFNAHWPEQALPKWEWLKLYNFRAGFTGNPAFEAALAQRPAQQDHPLMRAFLPQVEVQAFRQLWDDCDLLLRQAKATSIGICHLDCHPKNLFPILNASNDSYTVAIDWVSVGVGNLGVDIGHLLASPLTWLEVTLEEAAALRDPIFNAYMAGLVDAGWSGEESDVRCTYLTRLACEGLRNITLVSSSISRPEWLEIMETFLSHPINEICTRYHAAREFFINCKDEAMQLAKL